MGSERVLGARMGEVGQSAVFGDWVLEGDDPSVTAQHVIADGLPQPLVSTVAEASVAQPLASHEVPFQGPDPRAVLLETPSGFDWRDLADRVGRWPIAVLLGLALLAMIFAAFISNNSQSLGDSLDEDLADAVSEPAVAGAPEARSALDVSSGDSDNAGSAVNGSGDPDDGGRSTGAAGEFGPIEYYDGQLSASEEDLTTDISWVTTTTAGPTTATTPTSETSTSTSTSTSISTTAPPTTQPPPTTVVPEGLYVVALAPGGTSSGNPEVILDNRVRLRAEGQGGQGLRYRFQIFEWDERGERWELVIQSRWSRDNELQIDTGPFAHETVRWVAQIRDNRRNRAESDPRYFRVGADDDENGGGEGGEIDPELANGGFDGVAMGNQTLVTVSDSQVPGWSSSVGAIEVWSNGFDPSVQAVSGAQFIELNSTQASTIVQTADVSPGSVLRWSLAHRSRSTPNESIDVQIRPVGGSATSFGPLAAPLGSWTRHSGVYEVPDGVSKIEFRIQALNSGSVGNFIDDVRIGLAG